MELIRGLHNLKKQSGCILTIGNFDGVHLGHQEILKKLVSKSKKMGLPSLVVSFSVTPETFFGRPKARLSSFRDKHLFLESLGVDKHLLIRFNKDFSELSASSFINQVLVEKIGVKHCFIGDDFRFGKDRLGDFSMLKAASHENNYTIEKLNSVLLDNQRVSSSAVRNFLTDGNFAEAKKFLGRPFSISGKVAHGDKLGRTIGFPTANISIHRKLSPVLGVYSVLVKLKSKTYNGICNVGKRPTLGSNKTLLEVFIFDFNKEIYGEYVTVIFKQKCREEKKFESFDELKTQIKKDVEKSRLYFRQNIS
ncbi:bifunctional riboflavin kinase/FAD synthetase [Candidatus Pseudothioglobus singularis]|jgi:riboflavin kinase / FMN adenylyltransferase|uniref:Riboflavin biosynthesis protein n=1 Tax=Candidatus Pseudothioglobus singularis PS1 TaxID=1125411 RepID=A0A0M5L0N4_9GAMM|nr:bifunctional riboflavin kinase/FAD synthetase [Candidatus Pseudothioglobus singularis]ALE02573.1 bifunctional riboflavin biosynthesis protein RibF [Candidatus Pseudothioglobus singularis PS1]